MTDAKNKNFELPERKRKKKIHQSLARGFFFVALLPLNIARLMFNFSNADFNSFDKLESFTKSWIIQSEGAQRKNPQCCPRKESKIHNKKKKKKKKRKEKKGSHNS